MEMESCVPPGFRFHPTEEELVGYYLKRKITCLKIDLNVITDIDLYSMEPWDIEDRCRLGYEEQKEWYFFSHKDRKYPTGTRTNRATSAGFWKATGRDKAVLSKDKIIGMRKTLVFYKGRAPNGRKTDWIMHEFRLQTSELGPPQEEGWVVCRAFKKPNPKQGFKAWNNGYYIRNNSDTYYKPPFYPSTPNLIPNYDPTPNLSLTSHPDPFSVESGRGPFERQIVERPNIDSPSVSTSFVTNENSFEHSVVGNEGIEDEKGIFGNEFCEWRSFDRLIGSHVVGPPLSTSFVYPNTPLVANGDAMDGHNYFGCVIQPDGLYS